MAIHDSARVSNLQRSLQKYIQDNLQGSTGFPTDFAAANIQWPHMANDWRDLDYALRVSPIQDSEGQYFAAAAGGTAGSLKYPVVFLHLFVKREYAHDQGNAHLLQDGLDAIKGAFPGNLGIAVKNYQGAGTTDLGKLWLRGREPHEPLDEAWLTGGWMLTFQWEETDTA